MAFGRTPLFDATIPITTTQYIGVPIHSGVIGLQIAWKDATSAATITLELSSFGPDDAAVDAAASYFWDNSGETITGPTGAAAGSSLVNLENVRQLRARLKVVTTAATALVVLDGVDEVR